MSSILVMILLFSLGALSVLLWIQVERAFDSRQARKRMFGPTRFQQMGDALNRDTP